MKLFVCNWHKCHNSFIGFVVPLGEKMGTTRQSKVSRLIQRELADIFQKESRKLFSGRMISVTTVRITSDLSIAKAYLSIFPSEGSAEILNQALMYNSRIRGMLGNRIGKQLRKVPELEFYIDDSLDYINKIDNLLKQ